MLSPVENDLGARAFAVLERAGYRLEADSFPTRRPDRLTLAATTRTGLPAIIKLLPPENAKSVYGHMESLWRSSFGRKRQSPGLPEPLECLPEIGAVIMERVAGQPMAELGPINVSRVTGAMKLLGALHESDAQPQTRRSWRGILRSIRRKADYVQQSAPQYAEAVERVVQLLERSAVRDTELVPSHGDFSPRNVLVGTERMVIIDWDRFQYADPARDVTYFGTFSWRADVRRGRRPDRSALKQALQAYCAERPGADLSGQASFHIAAGLVRSAASVLKLWPQESWMVPALITIAVREMEGE